MKAYILVTACDADQRIIFDVTEDEYVTLRRFAEVTGRSGGGCVPYMVVEKSEDAHEYWSNTWVVTA